MLEVKAHAMEAHLRKSQKTIETVFRSGIAIHNSQVVCPKIDFAERDLGVKPPYRDLPTSACDRSIPIETMVILRCL